MAVIVWIAHIDKVPVNPHGNATENS